MIPKIEDLVKELREVSEDMQSDTFNGWAEYCRAAADEIESLRSQLKHQCELNDAAAEQAEVAVGATMIKMLELNDRLAEAEALLREALASIPCNAKFTLRRIDAFLATADSASGVQK